MHMPRTNVLSRLEIYKARPMRYISSWSMADETGVVKAASVLDSLIVEPRVSRVILETECP